MFKYLLNYFHSLLQEPLGSRCLAANLKAPVPGQAPDIIDINILDINIVEEVKTEKSIMSL